MGFFDEDVKNEMKNFIKTKKTLTEKEIEKIIPLIKEHYAQEKELDVDERTGYFSHENADYVIFKTDPEPIKDASNKTLNKPQIKGKEDNKTWMTWARFPLMTDDDATTPARITIFDKEGADTKKARPYFNWKTLVLAKGRMTVQYKKLGAQGYHKPLKTFVAEYNKACRNELPKEERRDYEPVEFEDIDPSDYTKNFTFNLDQILEQVTLK